MLLLLSEREALTCCFPIGWVSLIESSVLIIPQQCFLLWHTVGGITVIIATVIYLTILDCWQVMLTELCFTESNSSDVLTNMEWIPCWVLVMSLGKQWRKEGEKNLFLNLENYFKCTCPWGEAPIRPCLILSHDWCVILLLYWHLVDVSEYYN